MFEPLKFYYIYSLVLKTRPDFATCMIYTGNNTIDLKKARNELLVGLNSNPPVIHFWPFLSRWFYCGSFLYNDCVVGGSSSFSHYVCFFFFSNVWIPESPSCWERAANSVYICLIWLTSFPWDIVGGL